MVVEIIEFECVCARVYGPCVDWGRALTSENGYLKEFYSSLKKEVVHL